MPRHLTLLTLLCALAYFPGLTHHGLTNWQESIRLAAAREMHTRGDWVVPTIHGEPYLAKPPVVYWSQLTIARLRGSDEVTLFDLRVTVALAGWLGVILTYLAARRLLRDEDEPDPDAPGGETWSGRAASWSAAMLATGILTTRAARIGELDILLIPFTALAILASWNALRARTFARAIPHQLLAAAAFAILALTKGPPGVLTAAITIVGGTCITSMHAPSASPKRKRRAAFILPTLLALATTTTLLITRPITSILDALGIAFFTAAAFAVGSLLTIALHPTALRAIASATLRTAWPLTIAAGFAALFLWGEAVKSSIGDAAVTAWAQREAGDNLNALVLAAPARGLEVFAYGAGLGSFAAIAAIAWLIKDRPRVPRGFAWVLAWSFLTLIAFSSLGRNAHRYLLPMLPGVSVLGGAWLASFIRDVSPKFTPRLAATLATALAIGQGLWYGYGREMLYPHRSPRDFIADIRATPAVADTRFASLDIWSPAFDVYAGMPVEPLVSIDTPSDYPHNPTPIDVWAEHVKTTGDRWTVLIRAEANPLVPAAPLAIDRLRAAGLTIEATLDDTAPPFAVDEWRTPMTAVLVGPASPRSVERPEQRP